MSNVRVLSFTRKEYECILPFLYPTYSVVSAPSVFSHFILRMNIKQRSDREALDYQYSDCVIISKQIFDELWSEQEIIREVLDFARRVMGSRKRTFRPIHKDGSEFIDECIQFMFSGVGGEDDESSAVMELFDSYGSASFVPKYLALCSTESTNKVSRSMETFVLKVLQGSDSRYYQRAAMRLRGALQPNLVSAVESLQYVNSFYKRHYRDLYTLWQWMQLCRRNYLS